MDLAVFNGTRPLIVFFLIDEIYECGSFNHLVVSTILL